jgi:hypothetical protein
MSNKQIIQGYWAAAIVAFVITVVFIVSAFLSNPSEELLPKYALAELYVSAFAFLAVWLTLFFIIVQLRKTMARPLIEVAFNKSGEQQATLIYRDGKLEAGLPHPWLINKGNAVARYFQIDFIIPENIGNPSVSNYLYTMYISFVKFVKDTGDYILSYTNEGRYTLFVNRPYSDPNMVFWAAIDTKKCIEVYKDSFEIKYKVYGDWAETQEGKLKIICK